MKAKESESYSVEEYLQRELLAEEKHEYSHGRIVAMSGGTLNHGIIGSNVNAALSNAVRETHCVAINSEVRIFIDQANSFLYPDAMLTCGEIETAEQDEHAVINPILIVEVLSKSTERYDRGDKFHKYCSLPSFREYILIDQYKPVVDVLYREELSYWKMVTAIGLDQQIYINTLQMSIALSTLYANAQNLQKPEFGL